MTRNDIVRIELEARRHRARLISDMIRSFFNRAPRIGGTGVRTA